MQNYNEMMKTIRPFVNFNYDLRKELNPNQKRRISLYFNKLAPLLDYDIQVYRPRKKKNIETAINSLPYDIPKTGLKAIPIIKNNPQNGKIRIGKNGLLIKNDKTERLLVGINPLLFALSPSTETARALIGIKGDAYTFAIGLNEIMGYHFDKQKFIESAESVFGTYQLEAITGIVVYKFTKQDNFFDYLIKRDNLRDAKKEKNKRKRNNRNRR